MFLQERGIHGRKILVDFRFAKFKSERVECETHVPLDGCDAQGSVEHIVADGALQGFVQLLSQLLVVRQLHQLVKQTGQFVHEVGEFCFRCLVVALMQLVLHVDVGKSRDGRCIDACGRQTQKTLLRPNDDGGIVVTHAF